MGEKGLIDSAGKRFDASIGFDDHHRRLERHVEALEHVARVVLDLGEGQAVLVDEALVAVVVAGPCDADEVDLVTEFLCCRLDRGGFCVAGGSSG